MKQRINSARKDNLLNEEWEPRTRETNDENQNDGMTPTMSRADKHMTNQSTSIFHIVLTALNWLLILLIFVLILSYGTEEHSPSPLISSQNPH